MKLKVPTSRGGKIASILIVALVLAGTALVSSIAKVADGDGIMAKLFIVFLGAIISIQVIPGMVLLWAMLKGIFGLVREEKGGAKEEVRESA